MPGDQHTGKMAHSERAVLHEPQKSLDLLTLGRSLHSSQVHGWDAERQLAEFMPWTPERTPVSPPQTPVCRLTARLSQCQCKCNAMDGTLWCTLCAPHGVVVVQGSTWACSDQPAAPS